MDDDEISRMIRAAEGFAFLGLWADAWDALESLPAAKRAQPAVYAVRLTRCTHLKKWELGNELVPTIHHGCLLKEREAAGKFLLAYAGAQCSAGDISGARESVSALAAVWPEGRDRAIVARALDRLWD
jgi:hypothetical protein